MKPCNRTKFVDRQVATLQHRIDWLEAQNLDIILGYSELMHRAVLEAIDLFRPDWSVAQKQEIAERAIESAQKKMEVARLKRAYCPPPVEESSTVEPEE